MKTDMKTSSYSRSFKPALTYLSGRPDLTPMVDVLFLLLIFFMIGSSFVQVSGIKVDLPSTVTTKNLGIEKFVIKLARGENRNLIYFNEKEVSWEQLKQRLAEVRNFSSSGTVIICADRLIPFGVVARLMALAENANVAAIIATTPQQKQQETEFDAEDKNN
ncbi:MAG: biopolymer transporter ExbD [Victivallales bacterium]|nr:biopolymer transporter ExbD [Victivallales bacterium]